MEDSYRPKFREIPVLQDKYIQRFHERTVKTETCWIWIGSKRPDGYGTLYIEGYNYRVHRISYEIHVGKIPDGLIIDHTCRNRGCVNPEHFELVTVAENVRRGEAGKYQTLRTSCPQGHLYDEANTWTGKSGKRNCKKCMAAASKAAHAKKKLLTNE